MRTKKEAPKEPTTFRLDADLKSILNDLATKKNSTISQLINLSVRYFLEQNGIETDTDKKEIAEIILLLETRRFNLAGYEKYVEELKSFAKESNISEENIFKIFTRVLEYVWKLPKS